MRTKSGLWLGVALGLAVLGAMLTGCAGRSSAEKLQEEGTLLYKHGQYYKAIDRFDQALQKEPNRTAARVMLADCYLKTSKPDTALTEAQKVATAEPNNDEANLIMGQALLAMSLEQTTRTLEGGSEANPKFLAQANDIASKLRKKDPNSVDGMLLQAEIDARNQKPDLAEQLYRVVLRDHKDESRATLGLARVLMMEQKFTDAQALLKDEVKRENPVNPQAIYYLAGSQMYGRDPDAAWETIKPSLDPKNKEPDLSHHLLAGRILLARIQLRRGLSVTSTTASALQGTSATQNAGIKDIATQLASLGSKMKGQWPNRPESYYYRGLSYEFLNDNNEATRQFEEAIKRNPGSREYRMALSGAHIQAKQFALARQDIANLLKFNPDDVDARIRSAQTYVMEGKGDDAITALRSLSVELPENKMVKQLLGQMLANSADAQQVQEGLQILEDLAGKAGLKPGGKEIVLGQAAMREAQQDSAARDYKASTIKYQEAEQLLTTALQQQPSNANVALLLSQLTQMRGDKVMALAYANRAALVNPKYTLNEARLYLQVGQVKNALDGYEKALKLNPDDTSLQLEYAMLLNRVGRYPDALKLYETVIKQNQSIEAAYTGKAQALTITQGADAANAFLKQTVTDHQEFIEPAVTYARLLVQQNKLDEAEQILIRVTGQLDSQLARDKGTLDDTKIAVERRRLAPFFLELAIVQILNHKPVDAAKSARASQRTVDAARPESTVVEALADMANQRPDDTMSMIDTMQTTSGKLNNYLPLIKALAALQKKDLQAAREILKGQPDLNSQALELFETLMKAPPDALAAAAPDIALEVYLAQRPIWAGSVARLTEQTLAKLPKEPFVLARRAEAQQILNRSSDAAQTYALMQEAMPNFIPVRLAQLDLQQSLVDSLNRHGRVAEAQVQLIKAESMAREIVKIAPRDANALYRLGAVLQETKKIDEANDLYRQVMQLDPTNAAARNNLAWNLSTSGKLDEAEKVAQAATQVDPRSGGMLDTLGWIQFQRGKNDAAVDSLGRAARLEPGNPEIRFHLAQALLKAGNNQAASATLETMLLAWPTYIHADQVRAMLVKVNPQSPALKAVPAAAVQAEPAAGGAEAAAK